MNNLPATVSVTEAAEILGVGRDAAYKGVQEGQIPSLRLGRQIRIPTSKLRDLLGLRDTSDGPVGAKDAPSQMSFEVSGSITLTPKEES